MEHEKGVIESFHPSRFKYIKLYIFIIILIAAGYYFYSGGYSMAYFLPIWISPFIIIIYMEFSIRDPLLILDSDGLLLKSGTFSKSTKRIQYSHIANIQIKQNFRQRLFRYGDLYIDIPGSNVQQNISQNFSGKGDVKISGMGESEKALVLQRFQNVSKIEKILMNKMKR